MGPVSQFESRKRANRTHAKKVMNSSLYAAFGDLAMLDHSALIVWTRGQMNGVRATLKRLRLGCSV